MIKWEVIPIEFVVGFPLTSLSHYNSILVVVDRLTKSAHFIPVRDTYDVTDVARVFINDIVHLHGVSKKIIYDRDPKFTSRFWISMQEELGSELNLISSYNTEVDGQK